MEQSVLDGLAIIEENAPAEDTEPKTMVLRNLKEIPRIGYGCGVKSTFRDEVVQFAYENCGIKLFDTCSNAGTEECVKRALFDSGVVKDRRDVFLSGTLEQADFYRVSDSLERTLTNLGTDYLDLYLMNWPDVGCGSDNVEGRNRIWRQLEEHYQDGTIKAIGVGNFVARQLRPLVNECRVYPHVIQTELHPLNHDKYLIHYCRENGIVIQAHTPFARGGIMDQPMIRRTAALYGRPPTQLLVRWPLDRGMCVVFGANRRAHVAENSQVWNFHLNKHDLVALNGINNSVFATRDPRMIP